MSLIWDDVQKQVEKDCETVLGHTQTTVERYDTEPPWYEPWDLVLGFFALVVSMKTAPSVLCTVAPQYNLVRDAIHAQAVAHAASTFQLYYQEKQSPDQYIQENVHIP